MNPSLDPSRRNNTSGSAMLKQKSQYHQASALAQSNVPAYLAYGTGGNWLQGPIMMGDVAMSIFGELAGGCVELRGGARPG